ncbi:MAG: aminotransferase class V-fold PLP-dependent enzyme [Lewinellaceae bacterium]|nr:aminotransferase class V-fold PLP-dependent enzyme [Lewinellaceae bacterium]
MLSCQRHLFAIPDDIHYLNCAYMSPQLLAVEAAGHQALTRKTTPWELQIVDFFEPAKRLRRLAARLIHAADPDRIAIIPSASYGLSTVARNLPLRAGQNIVMVEGQFPSNVYPWQREADRVGATIKMVSAPRSQQRGMEWNAALLEAIDEHTAAVAIGNVHWTDGTLFDLMSIRQRTREVGAWLVIDGTQSVGALPVDVEALQPDALVCGGYKWLMGPYSLGIAYYGPAMDTGIPLEENWINRFGSEDFSKLVNYQDQYQHGAARYSVGEHSNFQLIPMLIKAIEQLLAWQPANIQAYCESLFAPVLGQLQDWGLFIESPDWRAHHLFGLHLPPDSDLQPLQAMLQENRVFVSRRGNAIRVSPHVYNTEADVAALMNSLQQIRQTANA